MSLDPGGFGWWLWTGKDATAGCGRGCEQPLLVLIALLEVPETAERWDLGLNTSCGWWAMTTTSISPSKRTEIDISGRRFRVCKKTNQAKTDKLSFSKLIKSRKKIGRSKFFAAFVLIIFFVITINNRVQKTRSEIRNIGFSVIVLIIFPSNESCNTEMSTKHPEDNPQQC